MKLARQQRFGKKCESLAGMQRSLFEEDVDADIAEISAHLDKLLPQTGDEEKTTTRPVRKPLPSPLPRAEKVIPPAEERCPDCDAPCTSFAMKSARSWNIFRHRSWSTAISARSTAVPAVRKCSAEKCRHISFRKVLLSHRSSHRLSSANIPTICPVSPAAHFLPNGGGVPRQYNGGYGRCCWRCTGPAGKIVTPRASDTGCYSCR